VDVMGVGEDRAVRKQPAKSAGNELIGEAHEVIGAKLIDHDTDHELDPGAGVARATCAPPRLLRRCCRHLRQDQQEETERDGQTPLPTVSMHDCSLQLLDWFSSVDSTRECLKRDCKNKCPHPAKT